MILSEVELESLAQRLYYAYWHKKLAQGRMLNLWHQLSDQEKQAWIAVANAAS